MVYGTALSVTVCLLALRCLDAGVGRSINRRYCGRDLTSAMSMVCDGWYKRSDPTLSEISGVGKQEPLADVAEVFFPLLLDRKLALAMIRQALPRYKRGGIVDECCRKPCSVDELRDYCGTADY